MGDDTNSTVTTLTVTGTGSIDLEAGGDLNAALPLSMLLPTREVTFLQHWERNDSYRWFW